MYSLFYLGMQKSQCLEENGLKFEGGMICKLLFPIHLWKRLPELEGKQQLLTHVNSKNTEI